MFHLPIQIFTMIELSAVVTLYASHKAILWGVCIYTLGILLNCLLVLYFISMNSPVKTTKEYIRDLSEKNVFLFLYMFSILGIYIYCISYNYNMILDENMSDSWYYYSYFVTTLMLFNIYIINNLSSSVVNKEPTGSDIGWMITTFLFAFVYIQYVISMYYRTDGFTI